MDIPESVTRQDLVRAASEITPLTPTASQQHMASVILLNGDRYDPQAVMTRALQEKGSPKPEEITVPTNDAEIKTFFEQRAIPMVPVSALDRAVELLTEIKRNRTIREELAGIINAEDEVISRYRPLFSPERTTTLTEADIWDFLDFNNNKHWSGLQRQRKAITSDMDTLHRALSILVDETRPIDERLNELRPVKGDPMVKGLGSAIITAILHVSNPHQYGVWNGTSEAGWIKTGLWPVCRPSTPFGTYYQTVNEILQAVAREVGVDLWTLDSFWWKMGWNDGMKPDQAKGEKETVKDIEGVLPISEQETIRMICEISRAIADADLDGKRDFNAPDAAEIKKRYDSVATPLLEDFKKKFDTTPGSYLRRILDRVLEANSISTLYESKGFQFRGLKIHAYSWAVISRKDPEKTELKASFHPQLYVSAQPSMVQYGFAFGDSVTDTDDRVMGIRDSPDDQERIIALLKAAPNLVAYVDRTMHNGTVVKADITSDLLRGNFGEWGSGIIIVESFPEAEIPEDIVIRIESTLSSLVPFFRSVSESGTLDVLDSPPRPETVETWADVESRLRCAFEQALAFEHLYFTDQEKRRLSTEILGALRSGKHIILTGPPGTGKSKVADAVCAAIAGDGNYHMCTASPDWSVFETIGGYRPRPNGTLEFYPGAFLRSFRTNGSPANRWLIVDEINRADIDKAFGPLFSALAGDNVFLPFEIAGEPVRLIGRPEDTTLLKECHFIIHPDWRIIATMNTYDKSSLYEMSYAFMRRFAFIMVDSPDEVDADMVGRYVDAWKFREDDTLCRQIADLWNLVNRHRKIGPALFHDVYQFLAEMPEAEMDSAIALFLFPQFEGLREDQQISFVKDLVARETVRDPVQFRRRAATFFHINPKGLV